MGGPRDEDPPVVLEMLPENQSLNTKPEEITLTFDEYIKLDNPNKNIIITPRVDKDELIVTAVKNKVIIELNQELEDSTTYVFNFQKSIQDLSEGNPAENLKLVFSTGNSIDSLKFSGQVNSYFSKSNDEFDDILIGLYLSTDTTDLFTAPPYYLSQVDSTGAFQLTNIKSGVYKAYAFQDDNNSLKAEFKSEAFDFISDSIVIDRDIEGVQFNLSKGDQTPVQLLRSTASGSIYELIFNRNPVDIKLENRLLGDQIFYSTTDKRIKLYSKTPQPDSLSFNLAVLDSVGYKSDTTVWAKFEESDRTPENLTITANSGIGFYQNFEFELKFNKPIEAINLDSLVVTYDSASIIPIEPSMMAFTDSLRRDKIQIKLQIPDSIKTSSLNLYAPDSTFQDIQGVFNDQELKATYKKLKRDALAEEISGTITGAESPFIVQLTDAKGETKQEIFLETGNNFAFKLIDPGNYQIRVIEDSNGNKRWDPGNFEEQRSAERVFYFKDEQGGKDITIRAGWLRPDQTIIASPKTGFQNIPE